MIFNKIIFEQVDTNTAAILIALLDKEGYEGFEETTDDLYAFIPKENFDELIIQRYSNQFNINYQIETIEQQNWNTVWESNYAPVIVEDIVAVIADFHEPIPTVKYEIKITPKMSFGTGHHATTWMMLKEMNTLNFQQKTILDFGTGTGVLAIFAHLKGATTIIANDIDDWSIENCKENFEKNGLSTYSLYQDELMNIPPYRYDIILANINLHILSDNAQLLYDQLNTNGNLLISGIMTGDIERVNSIYLNIGFNLKTTENKDNWALIHYIKT